MIVARLLAILQLALGTSAIQAPPRTVLDGVYSPSQAERGKAVYTTTCALCHGAALEGVSAPTLQGERFLARWREGTLDTFHDFLSAAMPPRRQNSVESLPEIAYTDLVAFILGMNGYRAGTAPLERDAMARIRVVGKDGPRPVPDGALVAVTGCFSPIDADRWMLQQATDPVRTRVAEAVTPAELDAARRTPPGAATFELTDLEAVPAFRPETRSGTRVLVKGFLIRQPNAERISLSFVEAIPDDLTPCTERLER